MEILKSRWNVIGTVFNESTQEEEIFQTGWAEDHLNSKLTNEKLQQFADNAIAGGNDIMLRNLAGTTNSSVNAEWFVKPSDKEWCKKNDCEPGVREHARHRANVYLTYVEAKRKNATSTQEITEERKAMNEFVLAGWAERGRELKMKYAKS